MAKTKAQLEQELNRTAIDRDVAKKELDKLKKEVTTLVMEHEGCDGCLEGRIEALESLGLEAPLKDFSITIKFRGSDEIQDINHYMSKGDVKDWVVESFGGYSSYQGDSGGLVRFDDIEVEYKNGN